ncbi:MAG: hypothetical protein Q8Q20_05110 [bacterium]|nr:hypothetical protein [bacterium]
MSTNTLPSGPAVMVLPPQFQVGDPSALKGRRLLIVQAHRLSQKSLGVCILPGCNGEIHEVGIPVKPLAHDGDASPPQAYIHRVRMCTGVRSDGRSCVGRGYRCLDLKAELELLDSSQETAPPS